MSKQFTRERRKQSTPGGRNRAPRKKTFRSKEAAQKWAESKGIKEYRIEDLKKESPNKFKFRIVEDQKE
ncbi:MAG: hypothetical protein ACOCU6_03235 [Nanoarchaeota archaeon]